MSGSREVHVAGVPIEVRSRVRQRCAWCGLAIIDRELSGSRHEERDDGLPGEQFNFHPPGALVAIVGTTQWILPFNIATDEFPADACAALDYDVTR